MVRSTLLVLALGAFVCACNPKNPVTEPITSAALLPAPAADVEAEAV